MIRDLYSSRFCAIAIIAAVFSVAVSIAPLALTSCDSRFTRADGGGTPPVLDEGKASYSGVGAHGGGEGADSSVGAHGARPFDGGDNTGGEYAGNAAWRGKLFNLSGVKAEIESAEIPDGADEAVWDALQKAFIIELERELERRDADASEKKIAAVPKQDAGRVDDFKFDSATGLISWTYKNLGDYDLSGEVGIADITAIALNFGKTIEYDGEGKPTGDIETPEGLENHRLAWIDGDKNGEIGISDVTPIALNYLNDVVEYAVVSADSATAPDGEWLELFRIILPSDKTFPVKFEQMLPGGARNLVGVRAVGKAGDLGERSNLAAVITTVAPVIYAINVPSGVSGDVVLFSAVVTGTHPRFYEWNFGGGAEPNITNDALPTVTLGAIGWYDGRLTVTNEYGTAIRDFKYYVPGQPLQPPVAIAQAWPLGGDAPLDVTFLSNLSYSPNGAIVKYEWDFESDGTYDWENDSPLNAVHTFAGGMWKATLRVTDEAGQVKTAETPLVTAYPAEGWQVSSVNYTETFPDIGNNRVLELFDYPISIPAFGCILSGNRAALFFPSHTQIWQRTHLTGSDIGLFFGGNPVMFAGLRKDGRAVMYGRPLNSHNLVEIRPDGSSFSPSLPNVPFMEDTRFIRAIVKGSDGLICIVSALSPQSGQKIPYFAEFNGATWTYEQLNIPNIEVSDLYAVEESVAYVTSGTSIWLSEMQVEGWSNRLVAVPPALHTFQRVRLHRINGSFAVVASYADESGVFGGVKFYIERDGVWETEEIVPQGDMAGFSEYISTASNGNFLSVAFWVQQNRVLRVLYYDGAGWSNEALSFSQVDYVNFEDKSFYGSLSSSISEGGELRLLLRTQLGTATSSPRIDFYYATKQLD